MPSQKRMVILAQKQEETFNVNCRYYPSVRRDYSDAAVMCTYSKRNYGHCNHCGWNPLVKAERLRKQYSITKVDNAIEYSQSITDGTNKEYRDKWKNHKPTRGEPDV